jgi:hypothetical protein
MNINYVGQILTTTSLVFEAKIQDERYCFFVKAGDQVVVSDEALSFRDYIENKKYTLDTNTTIVKITVNDDVLPTFLESVDYSNFVASKQVQIKNNNKIFSKEFKEYKKLSKNIDKTNESFQVLKLHKPEKIITVINKLGITDLANYYAGGEKAALVLRDRSKDLLYTTSLNAKKNLNEEKKKFLLDGDMDSVEEIDIILEMIDKEVNSTSFSTLSCIEDIYTQWPPILLPVPIERHGLFFT